jgi:hypothetical protein
LEVIDPQKEILLAPEPHEQLAQGQEAPFPLLLGISRQSLPASSLVDRGDAGQLGESDEEGIDLPR